ncbi:glycosyltransferase family 2 protein [Patescibacteria group bacterium]
MIDYQTITLRKPNITDFAKERNHLLKKASKDWILFLDSDETVSLALKKEINQAIKNPEYNYQLKRQDIFLNRKLRFGETSRVKLTRLVQKETGKWQGRVHEVFKSILPLKTLKTPLTHQRAISLSEFLNRLNFYSSLRAQELFDNHQSFRLLQFQLIFYPPLKFIQNYIFRFGFLDGLPGLAMAFFMSLHSLFVRIKLYELQNR